MVRTQAFATALIAGITVLGISFTAYAQDLTGVWQANDGGTYYIHQRDDEVWWYGEHRPDNPAWSNVARGEYIGNQLHLDWVDVPKGRTRSSGKLILEIQDRGKRLQALKKSGGFGGSVWTKQSSW
jgi:hypothetical protein